MAKPSSYLRHEKRVVMADWQNLEQMPAPLTGTKIPTWACWLQPRLGMKAERFLVGRGSLASSLVLTNLTLVVLSEIVVLFYIR